MRLKISSSISPVLFVKSLSSFWSRMFPSLSSRRTFSPRIKIYLKNCIFKNNFADTFEAVWRTLILVKKKSELFLVDSDLCLWTPHGWAPANTTKSLGIFEVSFEKFPILWLEANTRSWSSKAEQKTKNFHDRFSMIGSAACWMAWM